VGLKVGGPPDDSAWVTSAPDRPTAQPRPGPLVSPEVVDAAALLLGVAGGAALLATGDPGWTLLLVLTCALPAVGSGRARRLAALLALAGSGWALGLGVAVIRTSRWGAAENVAWVRSLLVMAATAALAIAAHRRMDRLRAQRDAARTFAEQAAVHDALTGLANRKGLGMLGGQILESARRRGDAVYCMFLDVDGLARVNTEVGHAAGDEVLLTVAEALSRSTRGTDAVARWGDDEFVVVGPGTGLAPLEMERRIRARCLERSPVARATWAARISAGGAVLEPWDDGSVDSLLREADREMQLRRTLRREAAAPPYRPMRHDPSPNPPDPRR
jgi:diguanylate cyclase (GGDEF)-like protein